MLDDFFLVRRISYKNVKILHVHYHQGLICNDKQTIFSFARGHNAKTF